MSESDTPRTESLRTPIVAVLGHVDHGKTTLLDRIRGSAVTEGEAGAITQHIGATAVPLDVVSQIAGSLVTPADFDLPGLLFIDTPGHHSFATLRARGGALADIAVLVIDVNDGFQPQTTESMEILRGTQTPFVVVANKIDTIPGWAPQTDTPIQESYESQSQHAKNELDTRLYSIIGELSDADFSSDFYWRVSDFRNTIGVIPVSAKTGEGVPDLLAVLMGLSQRYMREDMEVDVTGPGRGTVLEVKEERGLGTTIDVVVYNGSIRTGDTIVVGGVTDPIETDVRALLKPRPLAQIGTDGQFERVDSVSAAAGVKIAAPDLDTAMAGAPIIVVGDRHTEDVMESVREEMAEIEVETADEGVVVKSDTLGSLEAVANALVEAEVPIMRAQVGDIAPRDIAVASTTDDRTHRAILGFNVDILEDAATQADDRDVELIVNDVIYRLVEEYEEFVDTIEHGQQEMILENITRPAHFRILDDHVFRQNNPAVVGIEVLTGKLGRNVPVAKFMGDDLARVGVVKGLQDQGEDVDEANRGDQVSVAIDGPTVGRQIHEGDDLWVDVPEKHAKILEQELIDFLSTDEQEALREFLEIRRKRDPFWGK